MADAGKQAPAAGRKPVALAFLPALVTAILIAGVRPHAAESAAPAPLHDPAVVVAAAAPAYAAAAPSGFTLRRVPNPRYRPPSVAAPVLGVGTVGRLNAIDHLRFQYAHRGGGAAPGFSEWQLFAGEQRREHDAIEFSAAGESRYGRSFVRSMALEARVGDLLTGVGDVPSIPLGRLGSLQRLRGLTVTSLSRAGASWRGVSGVPTPIPGQNRARMGLAGAMIENLKLDESTTALALFGFGRGRVSAAQAPLPGDTLAGSGGLATVDVRAPLPLGALTFAVGAQIHNLDGGTGLAAQQGIGWTLATPRFVIELHDERATERARLLRTDGLTPAATREDRWNAQARMQRGQLEAHFAGVVRDGGDPSITARTMQVGASGSLGTSGGYTGADLYMSRRVIEGVDERRLSVYSGRISSAGHALLLRFDRSTDDLGRENTQMAAEVALALARGARLSIEPRYAWDSRLPQQAHVDTRVTWPLRRLAARLTGFVSIGAEREDGFRPGMREAALALALAPRPRDRAEVEVRRRDDGAASSYETIGSYDLAAQRYENLRGPRSSRDEGLVTVRVVRGGDHAGVADVLVLLDGKESRFTDASGIARFERVSPGVHLVSVEERSLPAQHQVATASRVFVTVERGRDTDLVTFEIGRPVRRTKF